MISTQTEPIHNDWADALFDAPVGASMPGTPTAADVSQRLASFEVGELGSGLLPLLAAAAAEIASVAGIGWRFSTDDASVALLRLIARASIARPDASGPHTARLFDALA